MTEKDTGQTTIAVPESWFKEFVAANVGYTFMEAPLRIKVGGAISRSLISGEYSLDQIAGSIFSAEQAEQAHTMLTGIHNRLGIPVPAKEKLGGLWEDKKKIILDFLISVSHDGQISPEINGLYLAAEEALNDREIDLAAVRNRERLVAKIEAMKKRISVSPESSEQSKKDRMLVENKITAAVRDSKPGQSNPELAGKFLSHILG